LSKARATADKDTIFVFCGDGVSDISAAKHCDLLFARNGKDLVTYCTRHNIPFIGFDSFEEIHSVVQNLVDGKTRLEKDAATGYCKIVLNA
jgi:2-hydroxy-3-keto-5-methylthiopentenyl-1-phosphate phosphatase